MDNPGGHFSLLFVLVDDPNLVTRFKTYLPLANLRIEKKKKEVICVHFTTSSGGNRGGGVDVGLFSKWG